MIQQNKHPKFKQVHFDNSKLCRFRKYKLFLHHQQQDDDANNFDFKNSFLNCSSTTGRTFDEDENIEIFSSPSNKKIDKKTNSEKPDTSSAPLPLVKLLRGRKKRARNFRYEQATPSEQCAARYATPAVTPADAEGDPLRSAVWFREDQRLWLPAEEQHRLHAADALRLGEERHRQARIEERLQANLEATYGTPAPPPPVSSDSLVLVAKKMTGRQKYFQHLARIEARNQEIRRYNAVHQRKKRHKMVALLLTGEMRKLHQTSVAQKAKWIDANNNINFMGMNNNVDVFVATWPTPLDEGPMQYWNNLQNKREERRRRLRNGEAILLHDAEMFSKIIGDDHNNNNTTNKEENDDDDATSKKMKEKKKKKIVTNDVEIDLFAGLDVAKQEASKNNNNNNGDDGDDESPETKKKKTAASLFDKKNSLSSTLLLSDMENLNNQLSYVVDALTRAFGGDRRQIAAVRVDSYNPQRMFLRTRGAFGATLRRQGGSAPMLYLFEAVARLAAVQYIASAYDFYIRSRFDLMPIDTLRLYPLRHTLEQEGYWYIEVGESQAGYSKFRSQSNHLSNDDGKMKTDEERGHRIVVKGEHVTNLNGGGHATPWKGRLLKLPGSVQMVVHQVTVCCMNDWIAVGRFSTLLEASSVYSWASIRSLIKMPLNGKNSSKDSDFDLVTDPGGALIYPASSSSSMMMMMSSNMNMEDESVTSSPTVKYNSSICEKEFATLNQQLLNREIEEYGSNDDSADPDIRSRRDGCIAETCIASALTASNLKWGVANLRVHLGHGSTGMKVDDVKNAKPKNVDGNICETKKCNYY